MAQLPACQEAFKPGDVTRIPKLGISSPSKRLQKDTLGGLVDILGGLVNKRCREVIALLLVVSQIKVMGLLGTC